MDRQSVSPRDGWDQYSYKGPEGLVVVSYWTGAAQLDRKSLPNCARIIIPCGQDQASADAAWALEDQLIALLDHASVACRMLGTLRLPGRRELVFQVGDWGAFRPAVGKWFQGNRTVELDVTEHDGWEFFDTCVWPDDDTAQYIADRDTIAALVKNGADPKKPHDLEFTFFGPDELLETLRPVLAARGYRPFGGKSTTGCLIMVKSMPLDLDAVFRESQANQRAAQNAGVDFDGWGTEVVK